MRVWNVDYTWKISKINGYLVIENDNGICIVLYQNDVKKLKTFLRKKFK
jgi:hypothetical protein